MVGAISLLDFVNQTEDQMRKGLVMKVTNESVFMRILRFIQVDGFSYEYGELALLGGIAFRGINEPYSPDAGVVNPKIERLAILGGQINTDRLLANKQGGIARVNAIMGKAGLFFDKYCIDGDPGISNKQFYGLKARLVGNQLIYPAADAGNGGALALKDIDTLIDRVVGPNSKKVLIMNKADRRGLKQAAIAAGARWASVDDIGRSIDQYDNVKIEVLDEDGDEQPILAKNETRGSSNLTSSVYCIHPGEDTQGEYVQGLIGTKMIEHEEQGARGTVYIDLVEMNASLAMFHGRAAARLAGIL
jgi:hypothetical protein